ncbi:hypothetical protein HDV00_011465, partial [Rhizophlyctis rosea]
MSSQLLSAAVDDASKPWRNSVLGKSFSGMDLQGSGGGDSKLRWLKGKIGIPHQRKDSLRTTSMEEGTPVHSSRESRIIKRFNSRDPPMPRYVVARRWHRLCVKLALFIALVVSVSVGVLATIGWVRSSDLLSDEISLRMSTISMLQQQHLTNYMNSHGEDMRLIASRLLIKGLLEKIANGGILTDAEHDQGMNDVVAATGYYLGMVLAEFRSMAGDVIFASNESLVPDPDLLPIRQPFTPASDYTVNIPQNITSYGLLWPDTLLQILSDKSGLGTNGQLVATAILNETHFTAVLPPPVTPEIFGLAVALDTHVPMQLAIQNTSGLTFDNSLTGPFTHTHAITCAYRPVPFHGVGGPWYLLTRILTSTLNKPVHTLRIHLLVGVAISLVFALILSIPFASLLVKPTQRLRALAQRLSLGEWSARAEEGGRGVCFPDEITELTRAFNFMADQLSSMYREMESKVVDRTRELEAAKLQADTANAAKSSFLATMTHEIRTPLNGIIGLSAILADSPLNTDQKDLVNSIRECSDGLLIIVNDVLDFSKIEAGKLELEKQPFNLVNCVEHALYPLNLKASQKGINLTHEIQEVTPSMMVGDKTRLKQVLINLVGNSVKFTTEGGVTVKIRSTRVEAKRWELRFNVS